MTDQPDATITTKTTPDPVSPAEEAAQRAIAAGSFGAKHDGEMALSFAFADGARDFDEYDDFQAAREIESAVEGQMFVFDRLLDNIRRDPELDPVQTAEAIRDLSTTLPARLREAQVEAEQVEVSIRSASDVAPEATTDDPGYVTVFKDQSDRWRWMAVHSNRYEDREREIFSDRSHRSWVDFVWSTKAFPTLRLFHVLADIGDADWVGYDDKGFVLSSGTFREGMEDVATTLSQRKDLGCSHGFAYRPRDLVDGVYNSYRTFEVSVLPAGKAANPFTAFFAGEEFPVIATDQRDFLVEVMGEERTKSIETGIAKMADIARKSGISYKALEEASLTGTRAVPTATEEGEMTETTPGNGDPAETPAEPAAAPDPAAAPAAPAAPAETPAETPAAEPAADAPAEGTSAEAEASAAAAKALDDPMVQAMLKAIGPGIGLAIRAELDASLQPIRAEMAGIKSEVESVKSLGPVVEGLRQSQDEAVAALISPRVVPVTAAPASTSNGTVVAEATAVAVKAAAGLDGDDASLVDGKSVSELSGAHASVDPYLGDLMGALRGGVGVIASAASEPQ